MIKWKKEIKTRWWKGSHQESSALLHGQGVRVVFLMHINKIGGFTDSPVVNIWAIQIKPEKSGAHNEI